MRVRGQGRRLGRGRRHRDEGENPRTANAAQRQRAEPNDGECNPTTVDRTQRRGFEHDGKYSPTTVFRTQGWVWPNDGVSHLNTTPSMAQPQPQQRDPKERLQPKDEPERKKIQVVPRKWNPLHHPTYSAICAPPLLRDVGWRPGETMCRANDDT